MSCAQSQPQQLSATMMMLILQPLHLVSLISSSRDESLPSADDVGYSADAYRSAAVLLLLHAGLNHDSATPRCLFPPSNLRQKLSLITTMRRLWLLEHAIGAQCPPPPAAFSSGPEREFDFLSARLGLNCHASASSESSSSSVILHLVDAVRRAAARSAIAPAQLYWPLGLPLQPSLHVPPECFSDLLVSCVSPCSCSVVHRAAVLCL
jgi:hypothetical protein